MGKKDKTSSKRAGGGGGGGEARLKHFRSVSRTDPLSDRAKSCSHSFSPKQGGFGNIQGGTDRKSFSIPVAVRKLAEVVAFFSSFPFIFLNILF